MFYAVELFLSPFIPLVILSIFYFRKNSRRILLSGIMLGLCVLSVFLGYWYADIAEGWNGLMALGAIWVGIYGGIYSIILLLFAIVYYFFKKFKTKGELNDTTKS